MKRDAIYLFYVMLSLTFFSCQDNFESFSSSSTPDVMELEQLEVGQRFHFIALNSSPYFFVDSLLIEEGETLLEIEVVEKVEEGLYLVKERLYYSDMQSRSINWDNFQPDYDSLVLQSSWDMRSGSLEIHAIDQTAEDWDKSYMKLLQNIDLTSVNREMINLPIDSIHLLHGRSYDDKRFILPNTEIRGYHYDSLYVNINNSGFSNHDLGRTMVSSKKHGIVRYIVYHHSCNCAFGWDRIRF